MLKIYEIYGSIQGESKYQGYPCAFLRLSGCNLRCSWCDTEYAFSGGEDMTVESILEKIGELGIGLVEVTGGEPLAQEECFDLMTALCDAGYEVLLETGGSIDCERVDERVKKIIDFKAPLSLMEKENDWNNIKYLKEGDEVKIVVGDRGDYDWAREKIAEHGLTEKTEVSLSPVHGKLEPAELSAWILEDSLDVRLNLQIHKYIWGEQTRGV
ncbi:MAG: radical SAM protein [Candidatus Hydrogenedentes bacterium]|nr:radical SAM protein [Candidatus Hydrogenedentota bacterium]